MDFEIILEAFELGSMGEAAGAEVYLDRETGEYFVVSDYGDSEELPDDLETEKYVVLPSKNELDLGKRLALRFASRYLEQDYEEVEFIFRTKGAYSRFKSLLEHKHLLDQWYEFERQAQDKALREWCQDSGIELSA